VKMNREISWEQLAKYFAGELNGEEQEKMESWIKANPEREAQTEQLRRIWKESETPPYHLNVDEAWSRLSGNMEKVDLEFGDAGFVPSGRGRLQKLHTFRFQGRRNRRAGSTSRRVILAAAAVLLIFTAALFTYYSAGNPSQEMMAGADHHILETQQGERASYQLSDGSRVILHAGSPPRNPRQLQP
jgi:ferric-dicitrate binding protein FerR (iron transport regulator)